MPNINNIRKIPVMKKLNIPEDVLTELGFNDPNYKFRHLDFDVLVKMNDLFTVEQKCAAMVRQGCHKTGKTAQKSKIWGKKYAEKHLTKN